jgi:hypothetical protein
MSGRLYNSFHSGKTRMAESTGELLELRLTPSGLGGLLRCPKPMQPAAGQYLLANAPESDELLPVTLFPSGYVVAKTDELQVAAPLPERWQAGMSVHLRGPLGQGFNLPSSARSLALACGEDGAERLQPLIGAGLRQGSSVVLYCDRPVDALPTSVELLPLHLLPEALAWADFLALDLPVGRLGQLRDLLGLEDGRRCPVAAQVLVTTPIACGGRALCGVCSVRTRQGWQRACQDGPVFDLNEILLA